MDVITSVIALEIAYTELQYIKWEISFGCYHGKCKKHKFVIQVIIIIEIRYASNNT